MEINEEAGVKLLNEADVDGSAVAAYELGKYYQPDNGFAKFWKRKGDRKKAIEMFRIAAEKGYSKAFLILAMEYVKANNGTEAIRWANGGDEPHPNNNIEHLRWKMNRSMAGIEEGCSYIKGEVYALGIGEIEQDLARAKKLFEGSYRKGSAKGAQALTAMYREGIGVEADRNLAEQWKSNAIKVSITGSHDWNERCIRIFAKKLREASTR